LLWQTASATLHAAGARWPSSPEEQMRKLSISAALALMLSCIESDIHAQAPGQEPVVISHKLNLTLEQRHVIKEFIKDMKTEQAPAQAAPAVGDSIPQTVNLQAMPNDVGQKVPQVKTHRFFIADGQIVIVDPKDNKVAEIIKLAAD
jgi:hypothetical protein